MERTAASRLPALRSGILTLAISASSALVILPTLVLLGTALPFSRPSFFLIRTAAGRGLEDEAEAAVGVDGDHHREDGALLHGGHGLRVELLHEFHDVHAVLTERGTDRRGRSGVAGGQLQLDITSDFLGHDLSLLRRIPANAGDCRLVGWNSRDQRFSTWMKSSSTGVLRPNTVTITLMVERSSWISSTSPSKLANGPSMIRTFSPFSK